MFQESTSLLERYALAAKAGFKWVECAFPYDHPLEEVVAAKEAAGVQQALINIHVGDVTKGELGTAAEPGREEDFKKSLQLAVDYAKALKCNRIHIMSGKVEKPTAENWTTYEQNIRFATSLLAQNEIVALIEPINNRSVPQYFMNNYDKALHLVKSVNSPNLKIMMDIFHLQQLKGNLAHNIKELLPFVGHIQIAQVPDRHEPDSDGEINYQYVLQQLEINGYDKWIGLEYKPKSDTLHGLKWVNEFGYSL
ncbi:Hypothetical predicted protein [Cloeon dipterum]|uniref:Putative hydroxypyruvate isomerase n=1 Tax=Cloeon dipterum TaxID=197152 RepID=A0A8S1CID5_9INSE|nr:Hypothetical predicted protein [Cloeon dipterum]